MSAARTFTAITGSGGGGAIQSGDAWKATVGEKARQALDLMAYCGLQPDLGGSDDVGQLTASYLPVIGYREFTINGDSLGGMTLDAVVFYRTADASTSVTVRVRNTTDSATAGTGATSTATTVTKEVVSLTLASGDKVYRLEVIGGDANNAVYAYGYLRIRKVPS